MPCTYIVDKTVKKGARRHTSGIRQGDGTHRPRRSGGRNKGRQENEKGKERLDAKKKPVSFVQEGSDGDGEFEDAGGDGRFRGEESCREVVGGKSSGVYGDFALKMMKKMGYEQGEGLGRLKDGIRDPILAVKRPRSLGLGVQIAPVLASRK